MEHPNHIDELLRQRLHDVSTPPPAFVWPNVEAALRKRRRRFLFFWLLGAAVAGSGLLGWWLQAGPYAGRAISTAPQAPVGRVVEPAIDPPASLSTVPAPRTPEEASRPRAMADHPASSDPRNASLAAVQQTMRSKRTAVPKSIEMPPAVVELLAPAVSGESPISAAPATAGETSEKSRTTISLANNPKAAVSNLALAPLPRYAALSISGKNRLAKLPAFQAPKIIRNKKETPNCYDFAQHPNVFLLDAYFGPSLAQKELHTGPDNQPYLAQRRNTEQRDWSFSAGVRGSLLLDRHFLIRSGVHYDQITEKFEHIDPNSVEVIIKQTTQIINGQPVTVIDTLGVEYGEHYLKTFNRFGMLDIPLQAGVELRNGRTGLSINGGISLNVLFWKRGAIISPIDGRPAYFTPEKGTVDVFRTYAGVSALGSVQWFCHLRPRLRVFAEPYVRMVLRPVNIPGHPVEQRYGMVGLNLGVTRIFD